MRSVLWASLISSLCFSNAATAAELFDFLSITGRFQIGFPAPSPSTRKLTSAKFAVTSNDTRHAVEVDQTEFAVERHDIPRAAALLLSGSFVLEQAKQGMLDDIGGREIESRELTLDRQPARRVRFEIPESDVYGDLLLLLVDRRLYLVTARYPASSEPPVSFETFVDSFEFWLE